MSAEQQTRLGKATHLLERTVYPASRILHRIGTGLIVAMMLLIVVDVSLRFAVHRPIAWTFEVSNFMLLIVAFFGLAYTAAQNGHVSMGMVIERLPPKVQAVITSVCLFISIGVFAIVMWASLALAMSRWAAHVTTTILRLPVAPFVLAIAIGTLTLCLVLLTKFLSVLGEIGKE